MTITTDIIHQVWLDTEGVAIEVKPDADGLDMVRICNADGKSAEYFGKIDVVMGAEMARALGNALLAASERAK